MDYTGKHKLITALIYKIMKNYSSFGDMLNAERLSMRVTLREFCRANNLDPAKISKLENNLLPVPKGEEFLKTIAKALNIKDGSEDYKYISDLADTSRGEIPQDLQSNMGILPAFCRKARMKDVTAGDLEALVRAVTTPGSNDNDKNKNTR